VGRDEVGVLYQTDPTFLDYTTTLELAIFRKAGLMLDMEYQIPAQAGMAGRALVSIVILQLNAGKQAAIDGM
jgi:hypothetical protein